MRGAARAPQATPLRYYDDRGPLVIPRSWEPGLIPAPFRNPTLRIQITDFWGLVKDRIHRLTPGENWGLDEFTPQVECHTDTFAYGIPQVGPEYPRSFELAHYHNNKPTPDTRVYQYNVSSQIRETWKITRGFNFGANASFSIPKLFQASVNTQLSFAEENGKEETTTISTADTMNITIPPFYDVDMYIDLYQRDVTTTWQGSAAIIGSVKYVGHFGSTRFYSNGKPLGWLFARFPATAIRVVDEQTVLADVAGTYSGTQFLRWDVDNDGKPIAHLYAINIKRKYPWWSEELLKHEMSEITPEQG